MSSERNSNDFFSNASQGSSAIARMRLEHIFDSGTFVEIGKNIESSGEEIPLVCGYGKISGRLVSAFSQAGAIGLLHSKKMNKIYELALKTNSPLIGFYDSHGLDMAHGLDILDDFGTLLYHQNKLSGTVLQISVVVGPCIGINAMLASSADYVIMSQNGSFFSAPPPFSATEGTSTASVASKAGICHITAEDDELAITKTRELVSLITNHGSSSFEEPIGVDDTLKEIALDIESQNIGLMLESIFDEGSVIELMPVFGTNVVGALAGLGGNALGIIATNGSFMQADDCVKIARLIYVWDSLGIPVVNLVNTEGMSISEPSSARDMAKIAHVYANSTIPKVTIITGKAYGAGYVALASRSTNSDFTVAWPSAVISPLLPKASVAFLKGDMISSDRTREEIEQDYIHNEASAYSAAKIGTIDNIIEPEQTREFLISSLSSLILKNVSRNERKHGNIPF